MAVGEAARRWRADGGRAVTVAWGLALLLVAGTSGFGATPAGTVVVSAASASWDGGSAVSDPAGFTVAQQADVLVVPPTGAAAGAPGTSAAYAVRITNSGNGIDRFVLQLSGVQGWPAAVYRDDNADGLLQPTETALAQVTQALPPGEQFAGVVVVSVPAAVSGTETTSLLVSSEFDPRVVVYGSYTSTATGPTADFTAAPTAGVAPLRVDFQDRSAGGPVAWLWEFGDGSTSTKRNPSHRYPKAGRFTVSLTVNGPLGMVSTTKTNFIVADFRDVSRNSWAYSSIMAANDEGLAAGYPDATYHPDQVVTRDQMATFMARALAGSDVLVPDGPDQPTFRDVAVTHWAYRYIEYVAARHVAAGYPGGGFAPAVAVDRAQMAAFVSRGVTVRSGEPSLASYEPPAEPTFSDVAPDHWAYCYIEYSAARGIVQGYPDGRYQPGTACTRDQMAVYLTRAFGIATE